MNEEEVFAADQEDRYFSRLNRAKDREYDVESESASRRPFSPDYFNAIWEGRN